MGKPTDEAATPKAPPRISQMFAVQNSSTPKQLSGSAEKRPVPASPITAPVDEDLDQGPGFKPIDASKVDKSQPSVFTLFKSKPMPAVPVIVTSESAPVDLTVEDDRACTAGAKSETVKNPSSNQPSTP